MVSECFAPALTGSAAQNGAQPLSHHMLDGTKMLAVEAAHIHGKLQKTAHFIHDWYTHHARAGKAHCVSNGQHNANRPWW
jgi:protein-arginine deiminase